jgi:RNA polymerase sigma-70 factor (ECF subfamily)
VQPAITFGMDEGVDELIPTRATLIRRLKDWQDQASWQDFFNIYWKLIYGVAVKGGLTNAEAEDVVQQTMIAVARHMPGFKYDPALGTFKTWLLNMTRWRIADQLRQRQPRIVRQDFPAPQDDGENEMACKFADAQHVVPDLEKLWDEEWGKNLLAAAIANARRRVDPRQYQIFDFYMNKEWPPERVAKAFGISINQVYLAKHRVTELIKEEVERLKKEVI